MYFGASEKALLGVLCLVLSLDTYILVFVFASRTFHSLFSPFHFLQLPSLLELLSLPMRQPLVVLGHKLCFSSMNSYFPECLGKSVMVLYLKKKTQKT